MATIHQILDTIQGVWHGTYTVVSAEGEVLERFPSRQEGLLVGRDWTEKVVYLREGQEPLEQRFHAVVEDDDVTLDVEGMWGETGRAGDQGVIFRFGWDARPQEEIIEVTVPRGDHRTRVWRHLEDGALTKVTFISEWRDPDAQPEAWLQA